MKIEVNLTELAYREVVQMSSEKGRSVEQGVCDALALDKWINDEYKDGAKILLERDGFVQEIIPL